MSFAFIIFVTQAGLLLHYLILVRKVWLDWSLLLATVLAALSFSFVGLLSFILPAQVLAVAAFDTL
jgi:hypothetical protein